MKKILILALSGIGDALMFTPALNFLREEYPSAEIHALVMYRGVQDIYERQFDLNKAIYFDFFKEGKLNSLLFIMSLRKKYDITINVYPSNRKEYNIINYMIGAKKRAGVRYLRSDKENFGWLNNIRVTEQDTVHNVITNIKLIEKITGKKFNSEPPLSFPQTSGDAAFANNFLKNNDISPNETIIGFHPGSAVLKNHINRRWEPEKFAALGSRLIKEKNAVILIFGGTDESDLKDLIKSKINSARVFTVSSGDLAESAALIGKCSLFISNDSSLMHVAAAMEVKTVAIIGPTNPAYIHPWKTKHKIVSLNLECAPCFIYSPRPLICFREDVKFKCIKELSLDMVYDAAVSLLN